MGVDLEEAVDQESDEPCVITDDGAEVYSDEGVEIGTLSQWDEVTLRLRSGELAKIKTLDGMICRVAGNDITPKT